MARRKMWTLLGHSMGEGLAYSSPMLQAASWLRPFGGVVPPTLTPASSPATVDYQTFLRRVYPNIFFWTAKSGWPGTGGTPPSFSPSEGTFLEACLELPNPVTPTGVHPYPSPYNYPNNRSMPMLPSVYGTAASAGGGVLVGVELPLSMRLSNYWNEDTYMMKLSVVGSTVLRLETGFYNELLFAINGLPTSPKGAEYPGGVNAHWSWWTPADQFDWAPGSGRLYDTWYKRLQGAKAEAEAAGDKLDIRLVVLWFGDNDATASTSSPPQRTDEWETSYRKIMDRIRADITALDCSSLPAHKISIIGMKIHKAYGSTPVQNTMNAALDNIESDDPYFRAIVTNNYQSLLQAGYTDASHISHNGYLQAANDIFENFVEMETAAEDALGIENRPTLEDIRDRVKVYYERGRVKTDAPDTTINQHINAALFQILNKVADNAWWLRRVLGISINSNALTPTTLPKMVHRVARIERSSDPGYPVKFTLLGNTDAGRLQIVLTESTSATYNVYFFTEPRELTKDEELIPLPYYLVEWLVVEATMRLARASGNQTLENSLLLESKSQTEDCMRIIASGMHARHDRLRPSRQLFYRKRGRWWWVR